MRVAIIQFGTTDDGQPVQQFILVNAAGITVKVITYGARLTELHVPDRSGKFASVVLGFDHLRPYLQPNPYFGATIGRYANRIAGGKFALAGRLYRLTTNDGSNTLHGGLRGFDRVMWTGRSLEPDGVCGVALTYLSPHMDQGFPGDLSVTVTYTLDNNSELMITYAATTDHDTPVNLSNHSYFNLAGAGSGDALGHLLTLASNSYTPVDDQKIPTGAICRVAGTPMDFTTPSSVGSRIAQLPGGYDHNSILSPSSPDAPPAVNLYEPTSGRTLEIRTTQPGMQFYSGNTLDGSISGIGGAYKKHAALVFEPQHFPNSMHHPKFPSTILRPNETYRQKNLYRFSTRERADSHT